MSWFSSTVHRLAALVRRRQLDADMAEEMQAHLELQAAENERRGMNAEAARYAARREFGGVEQIKERARDGRGLVWLAQLRQDLGYAVRALGKSPAFTVAAVLTLAIGIGVNTTMFSVINDLVVRPNLRARRENLVAVHTAQVTGNRAYRPFTLEEFTALRGASEIFSEVAAMQFAFSLVGERDEVQRRLLCAVSANYFSVLAVRPWRGRFFSAEEASPTSSVPVAVASYDLWQRRGGRADFVGSALMIDGVKHTVIGIAPAGFGGLHWSHGPDAWVPLGRAAELPGLWGQRSTGNYLLNPRSYVLQVFGALRPDVAMDAANARLGPWSARLNELAGATESDLRALSVRVPSRANLSITWPSDESGMAIYAVAALGMTITVLLVACLNVANMLFGRGVARQKEIAIRLCLGASRGRVVRQLLVEGFLLALLGGAAGLALSSALYDLVLELSNRNTSFYVMHLRTSVDWTIMAATFGLCLLATLVMSLAPALRATRRNLVEDLKKQPGEPAGVGRWNRFFSLRHGLVMTQIALSLTLLFSAGLLVRAVLNSEGDRGFETERQLVANLDYHLAQTPKADIPVRQRGVLERVGGRAEVERAALASAVPYNFEANWWRIFAVDAEAAGRAAPGRGDGGQAMVRSVVSHGYFATMGIPLLRGRDFAESEALEKGGPRVIIIDESLGPRLFGELDPLGRRVALNRGEADGKHGDGELEIVGIVRGPRDDAFQTSAAIPRVYLPFGQFPGGMENTYLHVKLRPGVTATTAMATLRRELRAYDPVTPVLACEPLGAFIGKNLNVWSLRLIAVTFSLFGLVAVVLAVVGVYGVKSYIVACRTREIGIRMAVGAKPGDVLALFLRQSAVQTAAGIGAGIALALLVGRFLATLLYRVSPTDPVVLLGAAGLLAVVSLLACWLPARRATRISPLTALRTE